MMKNIIMDSDKYFNVIDFSFSINYFEKKDEKKRMKTYNMVTPPEILENLDFDYNSDYYRLGSVIYYLIFKKYPYIIKKNYNISDIFINHTLINNYSFYCIDFVNKLLISDYTKRIGYKNINELKDHPWFIGLNWEKLEKKEIISPFSYYQNDLNKLYCERFIIPMKKIIRYKLLSKENVYLNSIINFNFINDIFLNNLKKN